MSLEQKIAELEMRQAFQDDTVQALNDVLVEQQRLIANMQRQLELLAQRQSDLHTQFDETPNDPPPHY
ncbi:SlyX family protein [Denitrificimonas caeni]|uniref:Protein SlyX homolog n=1 Tax=Denitrificimonas caeni TaxID=521720 RepID=A0AAE9VQY1_9GAMM|nr:SlyX family protein [Denitrificimonas caeni]WBE26272.1 SlyX family protein [Denitrificimonas caeni]